MIDFQLHDIVALKKNHACGTNGWDVVRVGADIKIKCVYCGHVVMLSRDEFTRTLRRVIRSNAETEPK